jgi:hypothetical protein
MIGATRIQNLKSQAKRVLFSFLAILAGLVTSLLLQAVVSGWSEAQDQKSADILSDWDETASVEKIPEISVDPGPNSL